MMSNDEYWDVGVSRLELHENNPAQYDGGQFRSKLMDLANKVESGEYSKVHMTFVACNAETQAVTVGEVIKSKTEKGADVAFWNEIQADIPDTEKFVDTWTSFVEDIGLSFSDDDIEDNVRTTIIYVGDSRSEGDTTRFVEKAYGQKQKSG